jgi:hypothetical protein
MKKHRTVLEFYSNDPKNRNENAIESSVLSTAGETPSPAILTPPGTNHLAERGCRTPAGIFSEGLHPGG